MSEKAAPEFTTFSLEHWGQALKVSESLEPDALPQRVDVPIRSKFFQTLYEGIYKGKGLTVRGQLGKQAPLVPRGVFVEHMGVIGANDLGELMVSREIFEGNMSRSLTKINKQEFSEWTKQLKELPMPLGWRTFALVHSHPVDDVVNSIGLFLLKAPRVGGMSVSWSWGDFGSFVWGVEGGARGFTAEFLISPVQIACMVATKTTVESLEKIKSEAEKVHFPSLRLPPYKKFREHGIVLYAGNHFGKNNGEVILERLI